MSRQIERLQKSVDRVWWVTSKARSGKRGTERGPGGVVTVPEQNRLGVGWDVGRRRPCNCHTESEPAVVAYLRSDGTRKQVRIIGRELLDS